MPEMSVFLSVILSVLFLTLIRQREAACSSTTQETEQNGIMGKLDEGLDDFFCKKVIKLSFK